MRFRFIKEYFQEIVASLKSHKLRTLLTSFGITWGIFILILLLGISGGIKEGVFELFKGFTQNTVWFYGGESRKNSADRVTGKKIEFSFDDLQNLKNRIDNITCISPELNLPGSNFFSKDESGYFQIKGVGNQYFDLKNIDLSKGRALNLMDLNNKRNVVVIGDRVVKKLFKKREPLGKMIEHNGSYFKVVGVLDSKSFFSMNEQNVVFIPYTTFREQVNHHEYMSSFGISLKGNAVEKKIGRVKQYLGKKYLFDPSDQNALYVVNYQDQLDMFDKFFTGINVFLLFVGCCMLLSGVIGVSNIMFIVVRERTYEIGIKKAIGATSKEVLLEFVFESVILTVVSGFMGVLLGYLALKGLDYGFESLLGKDNIIQHTTLEVKYVVLSIILLSLSGIIAGIFPAKKAAEIKPVEAMKAN